MIKDIFNPPICSACGAALSYKFPSSSLRKCIKCGYLTDIEARTFEDHKHAEYHQIGSDPQIGRFNWNGKVEGSKK